MSAVEESKPDIVLSTRQYEDWLGSSIPLLAEDIAAKHERMRADPFSFLRATFYRWIELWAQVCPDLNNCSSIMSVGDLHVENFGTWRDAEGRLVWGVNDFDEAYPLPFPHDLVRLAASALCAVEQNFLKISPEEVCAKIIAGYTRSLEKGGEPFILAENHDLLRQMAQSQSRDPSTFWQKLDKLTDSSQVPPEIEQLLAASMPAGSRNMRIVHRQAGLGSLGRQRYSAIADWQGGKIAREAKQLAASACSLVREKNTRIFYPQLLQTAAHCLDPFTRLEGEWLIRRLAPDCGRIELQSLPNSAEVGKLLYSMGWETANLHLGKSLAGRDLILADLKTKRETWLLQASQAMLAVTKTDWQDWKKDGS